jgi:predicted RNA-binding protein with PIN domain
MADATLYLFDGYNLLHAGRFADRSALVDQLTSFVAVGGARGIVVFDGNGDDVELGPLSVRFAPDADTLLERLAVEHRRHERIVVVSSDATVIGTVGREVASRSAKTFLRELALPTGHARAVPPGRLSDKLDDETRIRLEKLRRGE